MAGLQNSSSNMESINSHVIGSTQKLLEAYKSSHSVSNDTIAQLSGNVLQSADEAFRIAKEASARKIAEAARADFARYLAAQGAVVTRTVEAPAPKPAPVAEKPIAKVARQTPAERQPIAYKAPPSRARKAPPKPAGRPRKMRPMFNGHELPRGLKAGEDAITMKGIVCLEDGKRVKDLASHLMSLNITPAQYRTKWGLPEAYPMHAPQLILQKGATYDIDLTTGIRRRIRSI